MNVLDPGHRYELTNLHGTGSQIIQFVKTIPAAEACEGTTIQEVIRMLVNRLHYVNNQIPCMETQAVILHQRDSLILMESRASRRKLEKMLEIERVVPCAACGHLLCEHRPGLTYGQ